MTLENIAIGLLVVLVVIVAIVCGVLYWIARDLNRDDADTAAARKGEQSVEMWGKK